jgi:nitroimidazol reductase NimA-like FMN-containing flavoprotein (pyridoxamine 5'-phosphate oxidase superfamily)
MTQRSIAELSEDECLDRLTEEVVGRVVFTDSDGPGAVPVNYALAGRDIVFRVALDSHLRSVLEPSVAFEVDHVDPEAGSGWSVLVRGAGREVDPADVPDLLRRMEGHPPHPWAEGVHNVWVVVTARSMTGRHLTAPFYADLF